MEEDELLDMLETKTNAFQEPVTKPSYNNSGNKERLWDKTEFKLTKIDINKFNKVGKSFAVFFSGKQDEVPTEEKEKIIKIAKALSLKGFTFRTNCRDTDVISKEIIAIEGANTEYYLPWKSANKSAVKPTLGYPNEKGYTLAFSNHKAFTKIPATVRALLASEVHVMLGKECDNPLDIVILYSPNGVEVLNKDVDFKKTGNITFPIRMCGVSNIPVFNIKKEDSVSKLVEYVKSVDHN